jgi:membrane protease YdiL (CAAX protease family)
MTIEGSFADVACHSWAAQSVAVPSACTILLLGGAPEGVPGAAVVLFTVGTMAFGAVLASVQARWGIWPGVVAHAAFNTTHTRCARWCQGL